MADETPLHRALSEMVARGTERLPVVDGDGRPAGVLHLSDLVRPNTGGTA